MAPRITPPEERLRRFVEVSPSGCWEWQGYRTPAGYGLWSIPGESTRQAHRLVWITLVGSIPEERDLDHLCRNRGCVNPDHLEPVTKRENILRGTCPSAVNARKETCNRGHVLTGENLYVTPTGRRQCRECRRLHQKKHRTKQRIV